MFIRPCYKKSNGKKLAYWALVETYRTAKGPRQRVVAYLGQLQEATRKGVKQAAEGKGKPKFVQAQLFDEDAIEPERRCTSGLLYEWKRSWKKSAPVAKNASALRITNYELQITNDKRTQFVYHS